MCGVSEDVVDNTTKMSPRPRLMEMRSVRKPLMERRRRARINDCIDELKRMLTTKTPDPSQTKREAKLERADILELTVRHFRRQQRGDVVASPSPADADGSDVGGGEARKFAAGFRACAHATRQLLDGYPGLDAEVRTRLSAHLTSRLEAVLPGRRVVAAQDAETATTATYALPDSTQNSVAASLRATPQPTQPTQQTQRTQRDSVLVRRLDSLRELMPTKLPSGELAFVLQAAGHDRAVAGKGEPCRGEDSMWRPW